MNTKQRAAMEQALEALEDAAEEWSQYVVEDTAPRTLSKHLGAHITALRAALAEQPAAQEPVATKTDGGITLHVGWDDVPVGAKLYAALQPVTAGEPVYWEYKHVDDDPDDWQRVVPRTMQTLEVALAEIQGYRMGKKKLYEVRALYTAPQPRKRLSNQEIYEMYNDPRSDAEMLEFARAIEAAHGITGEQS